LQLPGLQHDNKRPGLMTAMGHSLGHLRYPRDFRLTPNCRRIVAPRQVLRRARRDGRRRKETSSRRLSNGPAYSITAQSKGEVSCVSVKAMPPEEFAMSASTD
jgi:hypothetical protein